MTLTSLTHQIRFPSDSDAELSQDQEWCEVLLDEGWTRIRFHDYAAIYSIPGLYEHLFYERLKCQSPAVVSELLAGAVEEAGEDPSGLPVLDLGAGNGMVGEALREHGFEEITGVDITPEAGEAVERDRPGVYAAYHVIDLLDPPEDVARELREARFGAMTSVAALGFGDVPPEVFTAAFGLVEDGGWIGFTIKEDFLHDADESGFAALIADMLGSGAIEEHGRRRYEHRLDVNGDPIHYVAIAGVKRSR
jgi:predicted TPR repeat methyltransferase